MMTNRVFTPAVLPPERIAIMVRSIYRINHDKNVEVKQYKARIVALGCKQIHELVYSDIYSPVATNKSQDTINAFILLWVHSPSDGGRYGILES